MSLIWAGKTDRCLPNPLARDKYEDRLEHVYTDHHWSTSASMADWVLRTDKQLGGAEGGARILISDCRASHISAGFR